MFLGWIRKLPIVNQIVLLSTSIVLLPPVSFDYTLLTMYTPLCVLLLNNPQVQLRGPRKWALLLLALIVSPLTEFVSRGATLEGQLKAILMCGLFCLMLFCPMSDEAEGEWSQGTTR